MINEDADVGREIEWINLSESIRQMTSLLFWGQLVGRFTTVAGQYIQ